VDHLKQLGIEHFKQFGRRIVKKPGWNEELSNADHAALFELLSFLNSDCAVSL
jgi:hypothetical protein